MALSSQGWLDIQLPPLFGIVIGGMGPSLVAVILTRSESGTQGIRDLLGRFLRWRVAIQWYLFVLVIPAATMLGAIVLYSLVGRSAFKLPDMGDWQGVLVVFLFTLIFGGPLGEELGWRGYALPRLLATRNALTASLIVGALWGLWHLPLFLIRESIQADIPVVWFMASILAETILYTWVFVNTGESLLLVCLFHTAVNAWAKLILLPAMTSDLTPLLITFGMEFIVAIIVVMLAGPTHLSKQRASQPAQPLEDQQHKKKR